MMWRKWQSWFCPSVFLALGSVITQYLCSHPSVSHEFTFNFHPFQPATTGSPGEHRARVKIQSTSGSPVPICFPFLPSSAGWAFSSFLSLCKNTHLQDLTRVRACVTPGESTALSGHPNPPISTSWDKEGQFLHWPQLPLKHNQITASSFSAVKINIYWFYYCAFMPCCIVEIILEFKINSLVESLWCIFEFFLWQQCLCWVIPHCCLRWASGEMIWPILGNSQCLFCLCCFSALSPTSV